MDGGCSENTMSDLKLWNSCLLELTYEGGWRVSGSEAITTIDGVKNSWVLRRQWLGFQYHQINKISATLGIFEFRTETTMSRLTTFVIATSIATMTVSYIKFCLTTLEMCLRITRITKCRPFRVVLFDGFSKKQYIGSLTWPEFVIPI